MSILIKISCKRRERGLNWTEGNHNPKRHFFHILKKKKVNDDKREIKSEGECINRTRER